MDKKTFEFNPDRHSCIYESYRKNVSIISKTINLAVYINVILEKLDNYFHEHMEEIQSLRDILNEYKFSLLDCISLPYKPKQLFESIKSKIKDILGNKNIDTLFDQYQERIDRYKCGWKPIITKIEILEVELEYFNISNGYEGRQIYIEEGSLQKIYPTWEEALACLYHGILYDVWTAFLYQRTFTGK